MIFLKAIISAFAVSAIWVLMARLVFHLPDLGARKYSSAIALSSDTALGSLVAASPGHLSGKTGIAAFTGGTDAFAARMKLIRSAQVSIDLQYYIWRRDMTGMLTLAALQDAAERGVRVRLLLDDNGSAGLDDVLALLNDHPKIEIRLFNPFTVRGHRWLGYTFEFFRLNRRMHNKSFTVDNAISIIGGRNVADEYFDTGINSLFVDLDVLAAGQAVSVVSDVFDQYWNSNSAYPAGLLLDSPTNGMEAFRKEVKKISAGKQYLAYEQAISESEMARKLHDRQLDLEWVDVRVVSDDPRKSLGLAKLRNMMFPRLSALLGIPKTSIDMVTPYLVPGKKGLEQYVALAASGVKIRILTNAMEATDVVAVHTGYAKYRRQLLEAGIELFEMKAAIAPVLQPEKRRLTGSASSSLHAKTFAVDGKRIFVGSFNFDPRSVLLNTEMGFLIESPQSAGAMKDLFDSDIENIAYRPYLTGDKKIAWAEIGNDGSQIIHETEPNTRWYQRTAVTVIGWLPIEWLL